MSLVTPADVRALVDTDLEDADLQTVIDREEAWLASQIGLLVGERDATFYPSSIPDSHHGALALPRHVGDLSGVTVTDGGAAVTDVRLSPDGWYLRRPLLRWVGTSVVVTYTPDDQPAVEQAIIDLVRLVTTDSGYQSEQIGSYGYSRGGGRSTRAQRRDIVRSLRRPSSARTIRVQGSRREDYPLPLA